MSTIKDKAKQTLERLGSWLFAGFLAGLFIAVLEPLVGEVEPTVPGVVTVAVFSLALGLLAGTGIGLMTQVLKLLPRGLSRGFLDRISSWHLLLTMAILAFLPFPLFSLIAGMGSSISDDRVVRLYTGVASIFGIAACVLGAGLLAHLVVILIPRLRKGPGPSPELLWLLGFPTPWLVVPSIIFLREYDSFRALVPYLLILCLLVLTPSFYLLIRRLPRWFVASLGVVAAVGWLAATIMAMNGLIFDRYTLESAPLANELWDKLKSSLDRDGDGYIQLFEGMDCDEDADNIYVGAWDIPGNDVDEDCNGEDARGEALFAWGARSAYEAVKPRKMNVIVLMADALRADRMRYMGYHRKTSPNLDKLSRESWNFTLALTQGASTGVEVPSLLSGLYPSHMDWEKPTHKKNYHIAPDTILLPDILSDMGYETCAVVSAWIFRRLIGFEDHFDQVIPLYKASEWKTRGTVSSRIAGVKLVEFLEHRDSDTPFFLYLHLEEPHEPYAFHPETGEVWSKGPEDRYDSDIRYMDSWVGFIMDYLAEKDLLKDTIVVFTSDHGEEFGDHGMHHHNAQVFQETIHVPLLVLVPGLEPRKVEIPVALVDIVPTILDLVGADTGDQIFHGQNLLRMARKPEDWSKRPIFSVVANRRSNPKTLIYSVVRGKWKFIYNRISGEKSLYNLDKDPREKVNLAHRKARVVRAMSRYLKSFLGGESPGWKYY